MLSENRSLSSNCNASTPKSGHLLIIHQGAIGDVVLAFPTIEKLHARYHTIDILCQHQIGKLAQSVGLVQSALPLESCTYATLFGDASPTPCHDLKTVLAKYQAIIIFSVSNRPAVSLKHWTDTSVYHILSRPEASQRIHVATFIVKQLEKLELIDSLAYLSRNESSATNRINHPENLSDGGPLLLIHPGSGSRRKNWALNRFLDVAYHFRDQGWQPAFILGPADQMLLQRLEAAPAFTFKIYNLQKLADLVPLLSSAKGYIGNDSGVTHLAGYLGIPGVAVFGPSDPRRWKPLGTSISVIQNLNECTPCFEVLSNECKQRPCLSRITVDQVIKAYANVRNHSASVLGHADVKVAAIQAGCAA